jgi:hypothetical protein
MTSEPAPEEDVMPDPTPSRSRRRHPARRTRRAVAAGSLAALVGLGGTMALQAAPATSTATSGATKATTVKTTVTTTATDDDTWAATSGSAQSTSQQSQMQATSSTDTSSHAS